MNKSDCRVVRFVPGSLELPEALAFQLDLEDFAGKLDHSLASLGSFGVLGGRVLSADEATALSQAGGMRLLDVCGTVRAYPLDFDAKGAFELEELGTLFLYVEGGSRTMSPGAARAANAMDEAFGHFRQVVIDDMSDVLDVDPAGSDVGGDQDAKTALLEGGKGGGPLRLRAVTMDHGGLNTLTDQVLGDALGAPLGAREDQGTAGFFGQQTVEHVCLAVDGNFVSLQLDVFGRFEGGTEREAHGIAGVVLDEVGHRAFHRGGEAQGLALFREQSSDLADRGKKTHVEHAVGLVQDERFHGAQVDESTVNEVLQAAGSSDNHASALADGVDLPAFG